MGDSEHAGATLKCGECKFGIFHDYGYSNYTVEGTYFFCGKKLHPQDGFDRFYGTDERLNYASVCLGYEEGDAITISVDDDDDYTPEEKAILAVWREAGGEDASQSGPSQ